jgi:site-specific recombinase XerD
MKNGVFRMTIPQAIEAFLIDQQLRGSTPKTIKTYRDFITMFTMWLAMQGIKTMLELTQLHVQQYQLYLGGRQCTNKPRLLTRRTVRTYMSHIKSFLTFCHTEGFTTSPIHERMKLPKAEKPVIEILTDDEVDRLLASVTADHNQQRNIAILNLMVDCGLRLSEVAGLKTKNVNIENNYIIVTGKGRKSRIVPIGRTVRECLLAYIWNASPKDNLFNLTANAIAKMFVRKKKGRASRAYTHTCSAIPLQRTS